MRKFITDGNTGVMTAVILFFVLQYPLVKPFPYSDDWIYIPRLITHVTSAFSWFFALHNDHRIPLQKIMQLGLLKLSGGDFRILIAFNVITVAATSICWIMFSRIIKKGPSWSEWIVPGVLLGFGFNTVQWGFNFQFVSGLFFLSLSNLLWARSVSNHQYGSCAGAFISLTLCAWCGANGHITSTIVGAGFLSSFVITKSFRKLNWKTWSSIIVWGLTVIFILIGWKSSAASVTLAHDQKQYFLFGCEMLKSWLGMSATHYAGLTFFFALIILFVAIGGSFFLILQARKKDTDFLSPIILLPVFLSALQSFVLIIVISYSRAGIMPWILGLETHYGYLLTVLPLSAWIVILLLPKKSMRQGLLVILTFIIGSAYFANMHWRINAAQDEYKRGVITSADILSSMDEKDVAHNHINEFNWIHDKDAESYISAELKLLRKTNFWKQRDSN